MNIAAVVILYNPTENAIHNIKTYYDYIDKIFVFDNTETTSLIQESLLKLPKIKYHHDFKNEGIAKRLNSACEIARYEKYKWLLTMDQDTSFSQDTINTYFDCFENFSGKEKVAQFGTSFSRNIDKQNSNCKAEKANKLITSGNLLNLTLFEKIGPFDEALFIDAVDYDYSFRAKLASYSIIKFSNIFITHEIGKMVYNSSLKSLFLIKKQKEIHSPLRCYYMYRNLLYLKDKYKNYDEKFIKQIRGYVVSRIKTSLLYGRDKWKIIKYLNAAKKDFKNKKMGKIELELFVRG